MGGKTFSFFFVMALIGATTIAVGYFFVSIENHQPALERLYQGDIPKVENFE